jgi:hypothetical protein
MSEDRLYYINNNWYTYEQAHNLFGCTRVKPEILSLYTDTTQLVSIIKDVETNAYYDSENHIWVNSISDLHLYKRLNTTILYKGDQEVSYIGYTDDINSDSANYVEIDNALVSITSLYNTEGITEHTCEDYIITDGEYISWYDPETELYWDNQSGRKLWSSSPPQFQKAGETTYIIPSSSKMEMLPQWEYDLSQVPTRYRVSSFNAQDELLNSQEPLKSGLQFVDQFNKFQDLVDFKFYPDFVELDVIFYVFPEEGAYDYEDVFHPQGDTFTGDYMRVWNTTIDAQLTRYRIPNFFGDNEWHVINTPETFPLSRKNPLTSGTADLNNQWELATESNIISLAGAGYTVVRSFSNYHVASQTATMYVRFNANYTGSMVFKVMSRGEANYDYAMVDLDGASLYSDKGNTGANFVSITVNIQTAGTHVLTVKYIKDGSRDSDLDRAYLAIPSDIFIP